MNLKTAKTNLLTYNSYLCKWCWLGDIWEHFGGSAVNILRLDLVVVIGLHKNNLLGCTITIVYYMHIMYTRAFQNVMHFALSAL